MTPAASGRARHCASCEHEVHDISAMTRAEAEALLESEVPLCGRVRTRSDGAIVVADGYVLPTVDAKRRLPIVAALAFGLAACTTSAAPAPPDPAPSVTVPPAAEATAFGDASDAALVRDGGEDDATNEAGVMTDATLRDGATDANAPKRKPWKPAPVVVPDDIGILVPHEPERLRRRRP